MKTKIEKEHNHPWFLLIQNKLAQLIKLYSYVFRSWSYNFNSYCCHTRTNPCRYSSTSSVSSSGKRPTTATAFTFDLLTKVCTALSKESGCLILPVDFPVLGSIHFSTCKICLNSIYIVYGGRHNSHFIMFVKTRWYWIIPQVECLWQYILQQAIQGKPLQHRLLVTGESEALPLYRHQELFQPTLHNKSSVHYSNWRE